MIRSAGSRASIFKVIKLMKNILITGVSTGIGYGATDQFIRKGYRVFGSVRRKEDGDRLQKTFGDRFTPLLFDLKDHEAIYRAAERLKYFVGDEGLAGLINNAGAASSSPLMHTSIDAFREHLEVLLVGHLVVTQAFLTFLGAKKECKHKPGRILFISSVSGKRAAPFLGSYVAAKHALEGMANTLRIELQIYGIDVIIVGPGFVKTPIIDKAPDDKYEEYVGTDYYKAAKLFSKMVTSLVSTEAYELDEFSKILIEIFETKKPKTRYATVKNKFKNWTLTGLLSDRMMDKHIAKMLELK
jgi:NAD(P)-dependent dehydrogenase (short-subunit alcohol dehydrogenase family)